MLKVFYLKLTILYTLFRRYHHGFFHKHIDWNNLICFRDRKSWEILLYFKAFSCAPYNLWMKLVFAGGTNFFEVALFNSISKCFLRFHAKGIPLFKGYNMVWCFEILIGSFLILNYYEEFIPTESAVISKRWNAL